MGGHAIWIVPLCIYLFMCNGGWIGIIILVVWGAYQEVKRKEAIYRRHQRFSGGNTNTGKEYEAYDPKKHSSYRP